MEVPLQSDTMFHKVDHYIDDIFLQQHPGFPGALREAELAGLPAIQVSAGQGKFLSLLARLIGAKRILEIGTLAGYSSLWLAEALPEEGVLITLENDPKHAEVARHVFAAHSLGARITLFEGDALASLERLRREGADPFDLVFLDADKINYPNYLSMTAPMLRSGGLLLGDNVVRAGAVLSPAADDPSAQGADAFNRALAAHPEFEAIVIQQIGLKGHDGLALARKKEPIT